MLKVINRTVLIGDVLEKIREIPDECIDTVITSPPYWALRDYGVEGQWGLEPTFQEYLAKLRRMMCEVKRVLKSTGSCWVNLGDTYADGVAHSDWTKGPNSTAKTGYSEARHDDMNFKGQKKDQVERKSKFGIPERFYAMCIDDGWIARNHIPWIKDNAMPSSVKDRLTNKWESIFFFTKTQSYYFNLDAIRVKPKHETPPFNIRVRENKTGLAQLKLGDKSWTASDEEMQTHNEKGEKIHEKYEDIPESNVARLHREREGNPNKQDNVIDPKTNKPKANYAGFNYRYTHKDGEPDTFSQLKDNLAYARKVEGKDHDSALNHPLGKNPGDVIIITDKVRKHFDSNGNCLGCGQSIIKHKVTARAQGSDNRDDRQKDDYVWCNPKGKNPGDVLKINPKPFPESHFATFPIELPLWILKCACPEHGIVLDPFFGAGTVGVAAEMLARNWIGIELKPEYVSDIIKKRLKKHNNNRLTDWT